MASEVPANVLGGADPARQAILDLSPVDLGALSASSIRVRTFIIGLTAHSLSLSNFNNVLHSRNTYPKSAIASGPHNDSSPYGLVPAWGYAVVLESTISEIAPETLIWGMFPASTLPVDLQLAPAATPGHWIETSPHRKQVMPLFQRYIVPNVSAKTTRQPELDKMAATVIFQPTWEAGYLLNRFVFGSTSDRPPIHPSAMDLPWIAADADLSSAILISLGAGSKAAKSFAYQLARMRPRSAGPLAAVEVSSSNPGSKSSFPFPSIAVPYTALTTRSTLLWISRLDPSRIVICNFGGRGNAVEKIYDELCSNEICSFAPWQVTVVNIEKELKPYGPSELQAVAAAEARIGQIQLNTSGIRTAMMEQLGEKTYFGEMLAAWRVFRDDMIGGGRKGLVWGNRKRDGIETR